jgi:hypothetical protein
MDLRVPPMVPWFARDREGRPLRIGIIAGEASGDLLGARLMKAIKRHLPDVSFEGIGGSEMQAEGCNSLFPWKDYRYLGSLKLSVITLICAACGKSSLHTSLPIHRIFLSV